MSKAINIATPASTIDKVPIVKIDNYEMALFLLKITTKRGKQSSSQA